MQWVPICLIQSWEAITAHMKNEFPNRDVLMSILSNHATASVVQVQGEIDQR